MEMKKEMGAMKLANKSDSDEIANKLEGKIDHLEKYVNLLLFILVKFVNAIRN
jgi:hypothetical protein